MTRRAFGLTLPLIAVALPSIGSAKGFTKLNGIEFHVPLMGTDRSKGMYILTWYFTNSLGIKHAYRVHMNGSVATREACQNSLLQAYEDIAIAQIKSDQHKS